MIQWRDIPFQQVMGHCNRKQAELSIMGVGDFLGICFVDSREPEEIKRFCDAGAVSVLIRRPGDEDNHFSNTSDANVLNTNYNFVIHNDGDLHHLYLKAQDFLKQLFEQLGFDFNRQF